MKLLFAAAEIFPYAKTGGLADVAQALPKALAKQIDVLSVMPLYDFIDREKFALTALDKSFTITLGKDTYEISLFEGMNQGIRTLFVYEAMLCSYLTPYGNKDGDHPHNDLRFGIFSKTLVVLAQMFDVDLLHLNDWHTALAALWAKETLPDLRIVFTIHNLAFQGLFPWESMERLGIEEYYFTPEGIEFWGNMNCMKAGIAYSDIVTTVSPTYAREILQPEFGCGLEGFLQVHSLKLHGILNGIDTVLFDPLSDPALPKNFGPEKPAGKKSGKVLFCKENGLTDAHKPLIVFIGRFTNQKGLDVIIEALPKLLTMKLNLAILGEGDEAMAEALNTAAENHNNLSIQFGYDESLSHRMYAAADFLLMPSRFEPCGLNQLIALRYGAMPIVNNVGGLHDTVRDIDDTERPVCGQGIVLGRLSSDMVVKSVERSLQLFAQSKRFSKISRVNMHCDVSFEEGAVTYLNRYKDILQGN
ncbi:MAG: glycogen/starch synthase [Campylobacterota bacterium]|nr:glycogen/starch synthase [Campylobacterota bacterium]